MVFASATLVMRAPPAVKRLVNVHTEFASLMVLANANLDGPAEIARCRLVCSIATRTTATACAAMERASAILDGLAPLVRMRLAPTCARVMASAIVRQVCAAVHVDTLAMTARNQLATLPVVSMECALDQIVSAVKAGLDQHAISLLVLETARIKECATTQHAIAERDSLVLLVRWKFVQMTALVTGPAMS